MGAKPNAGEAHCWGGEMVLVDCHGLEATDGPWLTRRRHFGFRLPSDDDFNDTLHRHSCQICELLTGLYWRGTIVNFWHVEVH